MRDLYTKYNRLKLSPLNQSEKGIDINHLGAGTARGSLHGCEDNIISDVIRADLN